MKQALNFQGPYYNICLPIQEGNHKSNTLRHPVCQILMTQDMGYGTSKY